MMSESEEYQRLRLHGPHLRDALQDHLLDLSSRLLAVSFISEDNYSELTNEQHTPLKRASRLVELIRNRVKVATRNYYIFLDILLKDELLYKDTIELLCGKLYF